MIATRPTSHRRASIIIALVALLSILQLAKPASAQPAVPTGLRVTAASTSSVSLAWNQNSEPNITVYEIYRTPTDGVLGDLVGTTAATSFTDTGLASATSYWYYIKASDGESSFRSSMVAATTPDVPNGTRLIAFGDMASCDVTNKAGDLGSLLDVRPGTILALGDLAYPDGSDADFQNCFAPSLGRHKARMLPAVGNHEYQTPNAAGYVNYFGTAAGPADKLYYETWINGWQILVLNSNCSEVGGCNVGSAQYTWLQQRIAAAPDNVCRIAAMHHPRWASYTAYADQAYLAPLYQALYNGGTDMILTGHAHHYERFAPQNAQGQAAADGFQLMIIGTGGVPLRPTSTPAANSVVRIQSHGLSEFDLGSGSYSWTFLSTTGDVLDSGARNCVNSAASPATFTPKASEKNAIGAGVFRLYRAVFLRDPDNGGFTYWHTLSTNGLSLHKVANEFAASPEFVQTYGNLDTRAFVRQLYLNVMDREPDTGGWNYWISVLNRGSSRGDVVVFFSQSAEFVAANPFP